MAKFASTIDEAMSLLKGASADAEDGEEEKDDDEEEGEGKKKGKQAELPMDDAEKALQIDFSKSETSDAQEFVEADEFMLALARNQDRNTGRLAKALEANMQASNVVLQTLKGFNERLDRIEVLASGQPQPRRSVLNKSEISDLGGSVVPSPKDGGPSLSKGQLSGILTEGVLAGRVQPLDVVKAESAGDMDLGSVVNRLSPAARLYVRERIGS